MFPSSDLSVSTLCSPSSPPLSPRKIDVGVYDEAVLVETELYDADPKDPAQVLNDAEQEATAARSALSNHIAQLSYLPVWWTNG